jgi:rod shape-determining protein MreC
VHDSGRTRLVLGVLLIVAIVLITLDFRDGGSSPVRNVGSDIFGPIERVTHDVTNPVSSLFDSVTGGTSSQSTIADLQRENAELRAALSAAQLSQADQQQLSQLLQLDAGGYRIVAASVIAAGGDYSDTVTLDVGRNAGIKPYETVLNGSGYVGYVTTVSSDTSTVLLADDASSTIGVQMAGSGQIGAVSGTGKSMSGPAMLQLSLFAASTVLQPGQQVDTYASVGDQPEVPGVPVGTVVSVHNNAGSLTQTALVRPFVNFTALGVVGIVVQVPRHNPPHPILPHPAPTVTVTVTAGPASSAGATSSGLPPSAGASPTPSATPSASATGGG